MSSSLWKNWKTLYTVGFLRVVTAAAKSSQHWICYVIPKKAIVLMHVDRLTSRSASDNGLNKQPVILYNFPPKGRWIVVDIYRDAKRRGIYPPLFTEPEGDSCFSIYQIRWIKNAASLMATISSSETLNSRNDAPFVSPFAKQWIVKDIQSYGSQSKRAKIAIQNQMDKK